MSVQATIQSKIAASLNTSVLEVENESHMHSVPANSETHFRVVLVSKDFDGKNLLARHRLVNKLLKEELDNGVHALAMHTFTPEEWQARGESAIASPECHGGSASQAK